MIRRTSSSTLSSSLKDTIRAFTSASVLLLTAHTAQAKDAPPKRAPSSQASVEAARPASGINYGFDADCGLDHPGEADIWKFGSMRQLVTSVARRTGCAIDGDHSSAHFRCYCTHNEQSLAGELEASKIPSLPSFGKINMVIAKKALVELCEETFHAQCGPLVKPVEAECGTPTKSYCRVSIRGDLKDGGYNLFDESCLCQGTRTWQSSQRLSAALGTLSSSAKARCQAQLVSCSAAAEPSFDPTQMLNIKGYTEQELRCGSVEPGKVGSCKVRPSDDGKRVEYKCDCDGAESGGSTPKSVDFGAKTLHEECVALLQKQCAEIWYPEDDAEDCDTSSSSDDDCENAETSSAAHDTGSNDNVHPNERTTETETGKPASQHNRNDIVDSLGCSTHGEDFGSWGAVFGFGVLLLIGWRSRGSRTGKD